MTLLTHMRGPFERARYSSARRDTVGAGAAKAHLAMIKRSCLGALTILLAGTAVAAIMALKIAIYLPLFIQSLTRAGCGIGHIREGVMT
jgi:hypothetical protein